MFGIFKKKKEFFFIRFIIQLLFVIKNHLQKQRQNVGRGWLLGGRQGGAAQDLGRGNFPGQGQK